jgi:YVTN family beta-propeller protein
MTNKQVFRGCLTVLGGVVLCTVSFSLLAAPNLKPRIIQTNSAGDHVDIIDPATNTVVGEIKGIEVSHGAAVARDGSRIYISEEAQRTLDVVDGKTLEVTKRIPLSGDPNLISLTPDGRWIYVAIRPPWDDLSHFPQIRAQATGGVDVIDTGSLQNVKTIPIKGGIHDLYVTPDGKYVVCGAPVGRAVNVIETRTNEVAWTLPMGLSIGPMAMSTNPDGSTKWIYVQFNTGSFNGFAVVDFATHEEIKRIKNPDIAPEQRYVANEAASHGIAVTSDGKTMLVNSRLNSALYAYSLPDLKLIGGAALSGKGAEWVSLTPDGKTAYVSNDQTNDVSVVDIKSLKEIVRIPVGFVPKRNAAGMLP